MNALPLTVADVRALVESTTTHTRAVSAAEMLRAINFGYSKIRRAVRAVKPRPFEAYLDPFTIAAGVSEFDVGNLFPPFMRPLRLSFGYVQGRPAMNFMHRSVQHEDSLEAEARDLAANTFFYDILEGLLPGTATTAGAGSTTTTVNVTSATSFVRGGIVGIPGRGPNQVIGAAAIPTDYLGRVTNIVGNVLTVAPPTATAAVNGDAVRPYRQKVLRIVPVPRQGMTGRLWYQYTQERLRSDSDMLEAIASEHVDCLVAYALAQLKLSIGDADADRWLRDADAMRAELVQDLEPESFENQEPMGSALHGVVTY